MRRVAEENGPAAGPGVSMDHRVVGAVRLGAVEAFENAFEAGEMLTPGLDVQWDFGAKRVAFRASHVAIGMVGAASGERDAPAARPVLRGCGFGSEVAA